MWTCPKCGTRVDPSFEVCWNCGTTADGVEDPTFVKADASGPIDGPPVTPDLDVPPEAGELPTPVEGEVVEAYQALDLMEAEFLVEQLGDAGIPASADTHDLHEALGSMSSRPRIYVREADLPEARAWLDNYEARKAEQSGA